MMQMIHKIVLLPSIDNEFCVYFCILLKFSRLAMGRTWSIDSGGNTFGMGVMVSFL